SVCGDVKVAGVILGVTGTDDVDAAGLKKDAIAQRTDDFIGGGGKGAGAGEVVIASGAAVGGEGEVLGGGVDADGVGASGLVEGEVPGDAEGRGAGGAKGAGVAEDVDADGPDTLAKEEGPEGEI